MTNYNDKKLIISLSFRLITLLLISFLGLSLLEIALRIDEESKLCIWPPNQKYYYTPSDSIMPGIRDTSFINFNSFGFRALSEDPHLV